VRRWIVTAGGLGFSPFAPGTVGSLAGVALFLACRQLEEPLQSAAIAALLVIVCILSVRLGPWAEEEFSTKDPHPFVLDEVAGYLLVVLIYRQGALWQVLLWTFLAARFFDIVKPPPGRRLEKLPGGWGILVDDLAASVYAAAALWLCLAAERLIGPFGILCSG